LVSFNFSWATLDIAAGNEQDFNLIDGQRSDKDVWRDFVILMMFRVVISKAIARVIRLKVRITN
jgi:hypothetical protein